MTQAVHIERPNGAQRAIPTSAHLTFQDHWDHVQARWGYKRGNHRVQPGLYALGNPTPDSPVFVTANYSLSFDAVRAALANTDSYILVLDTAGINVWCAAGKGTFGTDELVRRIEATGLSNVVAHRTLILPQLGATGVAAHEVKRRSGFGVEYGPVRAQDLPAYLVSRKATPAMRQVRFGLWDRMVLVPVELVHLFLPTVAVAVVLGLLGGPLWAVAVVAAILSGSLLVPALLPWIPAREFSVKGLIVGGLVAAPLAWTAIQQAATPWVGICGALGLLLAIPAVSAYLALNFTGSTPLTSPTGVRIEMSRYIRPMALMFALGIILIAVVITVQWVGG